MKASTILSAYRESGLAAKRAAYRRDAAEWQRRSGQRSRFLARLERIAEDHDGYRAHNAQLLRVIDGLRASLRKQRLDTVRAFVTGAGLVK